MKSQMLILMLLLLPLMGMGAKVEHIDPDEHRIRQELLIKTSLGTSMSQVMAYCSDNKLKCKRFDDFGYIDAHVNKTVGVKSIDASLKDYKESPYTRTNISAYWGFDKDEKLIDIFVWKTIDAP